MKRVLLPLVAASVMALPGISSAAVTVTHTHILQPYLTTFTVSSTDLVNAGQPTLGTVTTTYERLNTGYGEIAVANDGIGTGTDVTRLLTKSLQAFTLTIDLNTSVNSFGYDINTIKTYAGNSDSRARQEYQVFYSLIGSADYIQLIPDTFTSDRPEKPFQTNTGTGGGQIAGGSGGETELTINIGGLTNVDSIRFVTSVASGNPTAFGATVFREFDVFGGASTTIPEPSAAALLGGLGLLGLVRRRR